MTNPPPDIKTLAAVVLLAIDYEFNLVKTSGHSNETHADSLRDNEIASVHRHESDENYKALAKMYRQYTTLPFITGDTSFDTYIAEKTGFDPALFRSLPERIEKILTKGSIGGTREKYDISAMVELNRKSNFDFELEDKLYFIQHRLPRIAQGVIYYSPDKKRKIEVREQNGGSVSVDLVDQQMRNTVCYFRDYAEVSVHWENPHAVVIGHNTPEKLLHAKESVSSCGQLVSIKIR